MVIDAKSKAQSMDDDSIQKALRLIDLGNQLEDAGKLDDALRHYEEAVRIAPTLARAHLNCGNILLAKGDIDGALARFFAALAHDPDYAAAHFNSGNAYLQSGRYASALKAYDNAIALNADFADALVARGNVLADLGQFDEAVASYRRALELKPAYSKAHSNLLFCLNYHPEWTPEQIFAEYVRWDQAHARPATRADIAHCNDRSPTRRLRIGYVSPDLKHHSVRHFIEPLLANHDKKNVEVFAYAEVALEDQVSARLKAHTDHWRRTTGLSDDQMAALIRDDKIDILVDLAGHTIGNRLLVFAQKPAPIQISWLGYGYTTGLQAIDYFMAERNFAPAGSEHLFSEKLAYLPQWAVFRPSEGMGEPGALPALGTAGVTFGTLSRSVRINHRVIRVWSAILQRVPDARLMINSSNFQNLEMQDAMKARFAAHGIPPERLLIGHDSPPWDVLRKVDITLDCFPHNSGTTLFESLYMGVPFISLADRPSVGRIGAALLAGIGHPEWIAATESEYIEKAVALAADKGALAHIRAGLRAQMMNSLLMDESAFARAFESAYRNMWETWCSAPGGKSADN